MKTYLFDIEIEKNDDGRWSASCPSLPGCATWGKTKKEAIKNIREAIELYVEDLLAEGESIPSPKQVIESPAISVVA